MASTTVASKGVLAKLTMETLAKITVSSTDVRVRDVLLRIRSSVSFESNAKAVSSSKVSDLQSTLMFLRGDDSDIIPSEIQELLQPGLVHCVLLEVYNLLPYQCGSCANAVENQRLEKPLVNCRGCGIGACSDCFSTEEAGWTFICPPCGIFLDNKKKIPVHLIKNSRGRKKSAATTLITSREKDVQESVEEEVTCEDVEDVEDVDETTNPVQDAHIFDSTSHSLFVFVISKNILHYKPPH
jgi:hypothetical protein